MFIIIMRISWPVDNATLRFVWFRAHIYSASLFNLASRVMERPALLSLLSLASRVISNRDMVHCPALLSLHDLIQSDFYARHDVFMSGRIYRSQPHQSYLFIYLFRMLKTPVPSNSAVCLIPRSLALHRWFMNKSPARRRMTAALHHRATRQVNLTPAINIKR